MDVALSIKDMHVSEQDADRNPEGLGTCLGKEVLLVERVELKGTKTRVDVRYDISPGFLFEDSTLLALSSLAP